MIRIALLPILLLFPHQDGKVKLEWKRSAGDGVGVRVTSELLLATMVKDSEGVNTTETTLRGTGEFSQKIISVDPNGVVSMSLKCLKSVRQVALTETRTAINGRTFNVRLTEPVSSVTAADGGSVPSEASSLGGWEHAKYLLSSSEVAVGETWKVDAG